MEDTTTDGGFEQHFKAKYVDKVIPFTQTYEYNADVAEDPNEVGMYTKWLKGAQAMLTLPTVIVDVTGDGDQYDYLIEFTCKNESPLIEATELRFSARTSSISDDQLAKMKETALSAGIDEDLVNSVTVVDHSKCNDEEKQKQWDETQSKVERIKEKAKAWYDKYNPF